MSKSTMSNDNGKKTDIIKQAMSAEIEAHRKEIDIAFWSGSSTVTVIVKLREGKPYKTLFRTEAESFFPEGA